MNIRNWLKRQWKKIVLLFVMMATIIIGSFGVAPIINPSLPPVGAETRYMRSDTWAAGLYKLGTSNTASGVELAIAEDQPSAWTMYLGIKPYIILTNNTKWSMSDTVVAVASKYITTTSTWTVSATWTHSAINQSGMGIEIEVYADKNTNPPTTLRATFHTENMTTFDYVTSNTWTVYYAGRTLRAGVSPFYTYSGFWRFGHNTGYNSRISGFEVDNFPTVKLVYAGNPDLGIWRNYTTNSRLPFNFICVNVSTTSTTSCVLNWKNQSGWVDVPMTQNGVYYSVNITGIQVSAFDYTFNVTASKDGFHGYYNWTKTGLMGQTLQKTFQVGSPSQTINYTIHYMCYEEYNQTASNECHHHDQGTDGSLNDTGISSTSGHDAMTIWCDAFAGFWLDETMCFNETPLENIYLHIWWSDAFNTTGGTERRFDFGLFEPHTWFYGDSWLTKGQVEYFGNFTSKGNYTHKEPQWSYTNEYHKEAMLINVSQLGITLNSNNFYRFAVMLVSYAGNPIIRNNVTEFYSFVLLNVPDNATLQGMDSDSDGINDFDELFVYFTDPKQTYQTSLEVGWNSFTAFSPDVGHTLGEVNASLNTDSINWSVITIDYNNGTQISMVYGTSFNSDVIINAITDELWIYCNEAGNWYHTY